MRRLVDGEQCVGTLYVVATPIGNLEDMSPRAIRILGEVALIAAEDTRHSRRLLTHFGIATPLVSYHEHNQRERRQRLLDALSEGDVALISDAGTPGISDPGVDLVASAIEAGHRVSPIPGPSALSAAVSVSGLIDGPFVNVGFLPRGGGERTRVLARAAASGLPLVILESANRLAGTIKELSRVLSARRAVVARELTKLHEEVRAGTLDELGGWAEAQPLRGEIVLIVEGGAESPADEADVQTLIATLRRSGLSASQAAREAAAISGLPRSELYRLATAIDSGTSVGLEAELTLANEDTLQDALGDKKRPK
jgi:16S rRNA (cytidine1402-2'-O)-methyltransferase